MGEVHRFGVHQHVAQHGKKSALNAGLLRIAVDASSGYQGDEQGGLNFVYSGLCQAFLPHKALPDDEPWLVENDFCSLMVQPGHKQVGPNKTAKVGVPYGSRARVVLLYLQTEAQRTGKRQIELGGSLRAWMRSMDISIGGKSVREIEDQAERLANCRLTFRQREGKRVGLQYVNLLDGALFERDDGVMMLNEAVLSVPFFKAVKDHPVPLETAAIRQINNNSVAIDVYLWLAYRLHSLDQPTPVSWGALHAQFGSGYAQMNNFRMRFLDTLELVLAVYPAAMVKLVERGHILPKGGLMLHPSPAPVRPKVSTTRGHLAL